MSQKETRAEVQSIVTISPDGIIKEVNETAQSLLRASLGDLVGNHITLILQDSVQARYAMKLAFNGGFPKNCRLSLKTLEGTVVDAYCNATVSRNDDDGSIEAIEMSFNPHADNSDALLAGIVRGAKDAILCADPQGVIVSWNNGATELFGLPAGEMVGTTLSSLFSCPESDIEGLINNVTATSKVSQVELKQKRDGNQKFVSIEFSPVLGSGSEVIGVSAICRDVTKDKVQIENIAAEFKTAVKTNELLTQHASGLSRQAAQMELFAELSGLLQVCENEDEIFFLITRIAGKLYPHTSGVLSTTGERFSGLRPSAHWGEPLNMMEIARADCIASRKIEAHVSGYEDGEQRCPHLADQEGAYLCAPLLLHDELIGVMTVGWASARTIGDPPALATRLLADGALALSNLRLKQELKELAIRDALTGLYNRRHLQEFLGRELMRCTRKHLPLSLILFDVDHFKIFNDKNGHYAGDAVLHEVGRLTHQMVRASDIGCRYGGEEFLIVLPEQHIDSAVQRAELIRRSAEVLHVNYHGRLLPTVTLSLGVAAFPLHGDTAEKVIHAADAALYLAKSLGRNRVVLAPPADLVGVEGASEGMS